MEGLKYWFSILDNISEKILANIANYFHLILLLTVIAIIAYPFFLITVNICQ